MTARMPWIKLYTEFLDDPKVSELKPAEQLLFVKLLLFAGECDQSGLIGDGEGGYSMSKMAWRLRIPVSDLRHAVSRLLSLGLVDERDGGLFVTAFSARQGRPQAEQRQMWRERQQRKRHPAEAVTRDSPVTHAPREEKRREEERSVSASAQDSPMRGPRALGVPRPHPAIQAVKDETGQWPKSAARAEIENLVGRQPTELQLWRDIVHEWVVRGWNASNFRGMLECFTRKEVPTPKTQAADGKMTDVEWLERLRSGTLPQEERFVPAYMRAD